MVVCERGRVHRLGNRGEVWFPQIPLPSRGPCERLGPHRLGSRKARFAAQSQRSLCLTAWEKRLSVQLQLAPLRVWIQLVVGNAHGTPVTSVDSLTLVDGVGWSLVAGLCGLRRVATSRDLDRAHPMSKALTLCGREVHLGLLDRAPLRGRQRRVRGRRDSRARPLRDRARAARTTPLDGDPRALPVVVVRHVFHGHAVCLHIRGKVRDRGRLLGKRG